MTQQHITQEQAVALARKVAASNGDTLKDVPEKETIELLHGLANAAIQHYLDQHKAELPVLQKGGSEMTTPNEDLILKLRGQAYTSYRPDQLCDQAADLLQVQQELLSSQAERIAELEDRITELTSEEHSIPELRQILDDSYAEKQKCYFAVSQYQLANTNLITERDTLRAELANAAIQHYIEQQAKELPVLPQGYGSIPWAYRGNVFIESQLKAYGAACAAHARELALEEAKEAIESANARRVLYVPDCIDVIEALKGKR